jgi:hypothetical protein
MKKFVLNFTQAVGHDSEDICKREGWQDWYDPKPEGNFLFGPEGSGVPRRELTFEDVAARDWNFTFKVVNPENVPPSHCELIEGVLVFKDDIKEPILPEDGS